MNATGQHEPRTPRREVYPLPVAFRVDGYSLSLVTVDRARGCLFAESTQLGQFSAHGGSILQNAKPAVWPSSWAESKEKTKGFGDDAHRSHQEEMLGRLLSRESQEREILHRWRGSGPTMSLVEFPVRNEARNRAQTLWSTVLRPACHPGGQFSGLVPTVTAGVFPKLPCYLPSSERLEDVRGQFCTTPFACSAARRMASPASLGGAEGPASSVRAVTIGRAASLPPRRGLACFSEASQ